MKVPADQTRRSTSFEPGARQPGSDGLGRYTDPPAQPGLANPIHSSPAMAAQRRRVEGIQHSPLVTSQQMQVRSSFGDSAPLAVQRVKISKDKVSPAVLAAYDRLDIAIKIYIHNTRSMSAFFALDADAQVLFLDALQASLPLLDTLMQQQAQPLAIEAGSEGASQPEPPSLGELRMGFFVRNPDFMNQAVGLMLGQAATFSFPSPKGVSSLTIANLSALQMPSVPMLMGPPERSDPDRRESLTDHLMKEGGLDKLMGEGVIPVWQELANDLAAFATPDRLASDGLLHCGKLRLTGSGEGVFVTNPAGLTDKLRGRTREFMLAFMRANGELAYLERQPWFMKDEWAVDVEVNFYPNRALADGSLGLHKDTDSRNLFVSLIFNNLEETPSTEWTQDREAPNAFRAQELSQLPGQVNRDLGGARHALGHADKPGKDKFEGGVSPPNAYVSWVDELVWHSSPMRKPRTKLSKDIVLGWLDDQDASYGTFDAMALLAQEPGTILQQSFPSPQDFYYSIWQEWYEGYFSLNPTAPEAQDLSYRNKLLQDIEAFDWDSKYMGGNVGNVLTRELENTYHPTQVGQRPRSNSNASLLKRVKKAAKKNPVRSFIRAWVTINRLR